MRYGQSRKDSQEEDDSLPGTLSYGFPVAMGKRH